MGANKWYDLLVNEFSRDHCAYYSNTGKSVVSGQIVFILYNISFDLTAICSNREQRVTMEVPSCSVYYCTLVQCLF